MQQRDYNNRRGEAFVTQSLGSDFPATRSECVTFLLWNVSTLINLINNSFLISRMMKKLLTFFLVALLTTTASWAATASITFSDYFSSVTTGFQTVNNVAIPVDNNVSIVFSNNNSNGSAAPAYYYNGRSVRMYANNTLTVNCTQTITDIVITFGSGDQVANAITADVGNYSNGTWSGSSNAVVFTEGGSSGNRRIAAISVTYGGGSTYVTPPTITPPGGNFATSQQVELIHDDADAIYYTLDGTDPTTSSTQYSAPFTITTSTTVKAIAEKNGVISAVATAQFNEIGVGTIAAAYALEQGSKFIFTGSAVVTYQYGRNVWIRDNTGSGLIYRISSETSSFTNGDILEAGWTGTNTTYNGIPEFNNASGVTSSSNGGAVAPFDRTSTGITTANVNEYVSLSSVKLSWDSSLGYCYVTINNNKVYFRDYFNLGLTVTSNHTYNIEGIAYINNGNVFVYMTSVTEINTGTPLLEVSPSSLTIDDSGTGNTFAVEGFNLGNDNVGITHTNSNFTLAHEATTGSTYVGDNYRGFTPAGGSLNGTVAMNYIGRDLFASDVVTLANNIANTTVTVNYVADLYVVTDNGVTNDWHFDGSYGVHMTNNNGVYTATFTANNPNTFILFAKKLGENDPWGTRYVFGPSSGGDWWLPASGNGNGTIDVNTSHPIKIQDAGTYIITINANANTFTITKEVVNTGDFVLVTDVNDLKAGNEVIIVNSGTAGDTAARTMGERRTNNYYGTGVTVSNTQKVTPTSDTQIFTLEQGTGGWYFKTSDDLYLNNMNSGTSNNLQTKGKDANGTGTSLAVITIGSDNAATIVFQGNGRKYLRYNANNGGASTNTDIFSCYLSSSNQADVFIYQRSASMEPRITVDPSSLELVIPAGETSQQGTVTVTESNTTGATSVSVTGDDASYFTVSLDNGILTVTYSGTASSTEPDVATVTLTNGSASATVNVTGYKMPMTVTITPTDGHTFSTTTVTGIIESNVADATIEYSFDGTTWYTYDADNGFTTPEVTTEGGTVTVYARATYNGETATAQVTYTHEFPSKKCTADIVFDPTSNDGGVTLWSTLQLHMSEGVDYISDATMAAVYTSDDYDAMRFGSGKNVGTMTFTLKLKNFDGGACKLTKVTINAARYSNDTDCQLNVSTNASTSGQTVSITAAQDNFADYVFNFDGSDITTLTIANLEAGKRVYVHSITLEYNCPEAAELSVIESEFETSTQDKVAVTDRLIGVWAAKDILWAKDQGNASIDATSIREGEQVDYVRKAKLKSADAPFQIDEWDQSNWVMLDFSGIDAEPSNYVGFELENNSIVGHYVDDLNYRIELLQAPTTVGSLMEDYPGFDNDPIDEANRYNLNHYVSSNFYEPNLNWGNYTGYQFVGEYNDEDISTNIFFMNPKIQEIAQVWAVRNADMHQFTIYKNVDFSINGYNLDGAFNMTQDTWQYNRRSTASGLRDEELYGSVEDDLINDAYYMFHVVVMRDNYNYGHRKSGQSTSKRNAEAVVPEAKDSNAVSASISATPVVSLVDTGEEFMGGRRIDF